MSGNKDHVHEIVSIAASVGILLVAHAAAAAVLARVAPSSKFQTPLTTPWFSLDRE